MLKIGRALPWDLKTHHLSILLVIFCDHVLSAMCEAANSPKDHYFLRLKKQRNNQITLFVTLNHFKELIPTSIFKKSQNSDYFFQKIGQNCCETVVIFSKIAGVKTSGSQIFLCGSV